MDAANANAGAGADELLRERPHSAPTRAKGPGRPRGPSQKFKGLTPRPRSSRRSPKSTGHGLPLRYSVTT